MPNNSVPISSVPQIPLCDLCGEPMTKNRRMRECNFWIAIDVPKANPSKVHLHWYHMCGLNTTTFLGIVKSTAYRFYCERTGKYWGGDKPRSQVNPVTFAKLGLAED